MGKKKNPKQRHVPIRTCIATGEKKPKRELLRIVRHPETGDLEVDLRNKIRARGANISPTLEAFDLMVKKKVLPKALKLEDPISEKEYAKLRKKFRDAIEEKNFRPSNKPVKIRVKKKDIEKLDN
ncbi:DUF448 domain-containing protein [Candidatus Dojkabacteria bacterium]|nr:DUF448 domain-containing protein [Candidatus Dojkabacteria bacterium]